jgi:hypothetical protein
MFEPLEHFTPGRRREPGPHTLRIDEVLAAVEGHYQRINSQIAGNVATHHELVPKVNRYGCAYDKGAQDCSARIGQLILVLL